MSGSAARASCGRSRPFATRRARSDSGVASIHSSVSTSLVVRSQSTGGTRKSGSSLVFSAISESAAASSRKSISTVTERRKVSTTSTSRSRRASAERSSAWRATKLKARRSAWKRCSTPGRSTLTATARGPSAVATSARCTCAIEAAATAGPEAREHRARRPARTTPRPPPPPPPAETAASGPAAVPDRGASAAPTTSGRVARNWPSLT